MIRQSRHWNRPGRLVPPGRQKSRGQDLSRSGSGMKSTSIPKRPETPKGCEGCETTGPQNVEETVNHQFTATSPRATKNTQETTWKRLCERRFHSVVEDASTIPPQTITIPVWSQDLIHQHPPPPTSSSTEHGRLARSVTK